MWLEPSRDDTLHQERYLIRLPHLSHSYLTFLVEIIDGLTKRPPSFEPNYKASYSNMAFVLLGFALENMTGLGYADIVRSNIFDPLGMKRATLAKPPDTEGVIPSLLNDWNTDEGTYGP